MINKTDTLGVCFFIIFETDLYTAPNQNIKNNGTV